MVVVRVPVLDSVCLGSEREDVAKDTFLIWSSKVRSSLQIERGDYTCFAQHSCRALTPHPEENCFSLLLPQQQAPHSLSVTAALQLTHSQEDSSRCSDNSSYEEPFVPPSQPSRPPPAGDKARRDLELLTCTHAGPGGHGTPLLPSEPTKWNVDDVLHLKFIRLCQVRPWEFHACLE